MGVKSSERTSQACEACRSHKLRCRPSMTATACQRCTNFQISCEPHLPNKRRRKSRKPYQELEERIDRLSKSLQARHEYASRDAIDPDRVPVSRHGVPAVGSECPSPAHAHIDSESLSVRQQTVSELLLDCLDVSLVGVSLTSLTEERASQWTDRYQSLCEAFPFVLIGPSDAKQLVAGQPFLAVAIFVVCSTDDSSLHAELEKVFRQCLAQKVIVEGKRNLELLQGLLLYLAWHQHYLRHEDQQVYQYLQLAIAMTVDLELDKVSLMAGAMPSRLELHQARAFVGCYYLSCGYCILGFRKPRYLVHSEGIAKSADLLAVNGLHPHDKHTPALAKLMQTVERSVNATTTEVNSLRIQLLRWKMEHCGHDSPTLHLTTYYHWQLTISQGLRAESQDRGQAACFAQAQSLLDHLLQQSKEYLRNMAQVEWIALISGTISLVSFSSDQTVQDTIIVYLEKELSIMFDLGARPDDEDNRGVYAWYANLLQLLMLRLTRQRNAAVQQTDDEAPFDTVKRMTAQLRDSSCHEARHNDQKSWEQTAMDWLELPLDLFQFP